MSNGDVGFTLATVLVAAIVTALTSIIFFMLIMASIIVAIFSLMADAVVDGELVPTALIADTR